MRHQRHTLLVAALAVAVIAAVPGGAVAASGLSVSGDQAADGTVTVTVTENESAVANASVTVEALNNSTYVDEGEYTTDENGTVELAAPEQNVSVAVTASANNSTAETTLDLVAPTDDDTGGLAVGVTQADDGSATVSVTNGTEGVANASVSVTAQDNVTYAGEDDYTTDENGTVDLPAPEQNVTVDVVAAANNQTASTTATLTVANDSGGELSFGERVSAFVHQLQADGNMSGQQVAAFVVSNNPGADNRPDHAGPPGDDDEDDESDRGKDGDNGNGAESDNGNGADGNGAGNGNGNGNGPGNGNGAGNGNGNSDNGAGNGGNGDGGPP